MVAMTGERDTAQPPWRTATDAEAAAAPGGPGAPSTWTPGAKDLVTAALGNCLWATLGQGIVTEVYWPSTGEPQIRDLGFIVAGAGWWREVKRQPGYVISTPDPGLLVPTIVHRGDGYRLTLDVVVDPQRPVLLLHYVLAGTGLRLYPLLAPHLEAHPVDHAADDHTSGMDNVAAVGPGGSLWAQRGRRSLSLVADPGFARASAGYVGVSDGWQDFNRNGQMTWTYERAGPGNVALMGELLASEGVIAVGFAESPQDAETAARQSLAAGFARARTSVVQGWEAWTQRLTLPPVKPDDPPELPSAMRRSAAVIRSHQDATYPGAFVASLSIPWGNVRNDLGGYHLVWPRDAVEAGLGLLALGQADDATRLLGYLIERQAPDGHWPQNFYPDGTPFWTGVQLDETALPVILAAKLDDLGHGLPPRAPEMIAAAAGYLVRNGPLTAQDRWEENPGGSPFTLGVIVAAMVAAAKFLDGAPRRYLVGLADSWNERIEEWTYASGDPFGLRVPVSGHYVRIGPPVSQGGLRGFVDIKNRDDVVLKAEAVVGLEFMYLARLGLRSVDDERMANSVQVVEAVLGKDLPAGRAYYRYNMDGYGEREDGGPFTGLGVGRPWPLLAGERGHYALLEGHDPLPQLRAMLAMSNDHGLLPEQVWDRGDLPALELFEGRPSGSAMPLVWAHSELVKLVAARHQGRPVERLDAVEDRYHGRVPRAQTWYWRESVPFAILPRGRDLVIEAPQPFTLHFGHDGWRDAAQRDSAPLGFEMQGVTLKAAETAGWSTVDFARADQGGQGGPSVNHEVEVHDEARPSLPARPV